MKYITTPWGTYTFCCKLESIRRRITVCSLILQRLAEWVAIQSVSAWPEKREEIKKMMEVAAKEIERLGGSTELVDIGKQKVTCLIQSVFSWFMTELYSRL